MTLKNLFSVKRSNRLWLAVISLLVNILYYPVGTILAISSARSAQLSLGKAVSHAIVRSRVLPLIGVTQPGFIIAFILAMVIGLEGYHYLYSRTSEDFYESLPVKRSTRFWVIYIQGFLIWLVPYLLSSFLSLMICAVTCGMKAAFLGSFLLGIVNILFLFAGTYALTILAGMLSGRLSIAILNTFFLMGVEGLYRLIINGLSSIFLMTWYGDGKTLRIISLPLWHYLMILSGINGAFVKGIGRVSCKADFLNLLLAVIFTVLAFIVYKKRKAEDAGSSLIFGWARVFVRLTCSAAAGFLSFILLKMLTGSTGSGLILGVLMTILIAAIIQVIYEGDIHAFFRRMPEALITTAVMALVVIGFRYDWCGYDSYIPRAKSLKSYAFANENDNYDEISMPKAIGYGDTDTLTTMEQNTIRSMQLTDTKDIIRLAEISKKEAAVLKENQETDYWRVIVTYRLKSGMTKQRYMLIPYDVDEDDMNAIMTQDAYKAAVYPDVSAQLKERDDHYIIYSDANDVTTDLDSLDYDAFIRAYQKDLSFYDFHMITRVSPLGFLEVNINLKANEQDIYYPIYPDYVNTITFLQSYGIDPTASVPKASDISYIDVDYVGADGSDNKSQGYSDPDQIQQILDASILNVGYNSWNIINTELTDDHYVLTIYLKGKDEEEPFNNYYVQEGKIPGFVKKDLAEDK